MHERFASVADILRQRAQDDPDAVAYTFIRGSDGAETALTRGELDRRARAVACALRGRAAPGERALLMLDPGPGFVAALFGCLYAGVVAVPITPPHRSRGIDRVRAVAMDCRPALVLLDQGMALRCAASRSAVVELAAADWLDIDALPQAAPEFCADQQAGAGAGLAILQYTSGSTATPKGVRLTHGNILHNLRSVREAFGHTAHSVVVGWLPLFHDMGLIGNLLQPLYAGCRCVLMPPMRFVQRPIRWLQAISRHRATTSGGPNFAFDLCVDATTAEERAGLDLSCWALAFNGSERVRAETMERFAARFAPFGFRAQAFYPCYGLAEGTLIVTGGTRGTPAPVIAAADGRARFVSSGRALPGHVVRIVDPDVGTVCADGVIGELWIAGGNVATAYWGRPPDKADFAARLDSEDGVFFRTGDLGLVQGGEVFVTGRLKDLVIVRGRNLHPEDLEATVCASDPIFRPGGCAVVGVDQDGAESVCVLVELASRRAFDAEALRAVIDRALARDHDVVAARVLFLPPHALPRTSSGKLQRHRALLVAEQQALSA